MPAESELNVLQKWQQVQTELRDRHGVNGLKLTDVGRTVPQGDQLIGDTLLLAVPSERVRQTMQSTLQEQLGEALRSVFGRDILCAYVIDLISRRSSRPAPNPSSPPPRPPRPLQSPRPPPPPWTTSIPCQHRRTGRASLRG